MNHFFIVLCPPSVRHVLDVSQVFSVKSGQMDMKKHVKHKGIASQHSYVQDVQTVTVIIIKHHE